MAPVADVLRYVEAETALDVVAIADHDQVGGALEAVEWCAGRAAGRVRAIVATEISSAWGRHVLALFFQAPFPERPFPRFRPLAETLARVEDAGGLAVVPHPLSPLVPSLGRRTLDATLRLPCPARVLQGIEVCSGVVGGRRTSAALRRLNAARWGLAEVGNSDAHHLAQIGSAFTAFPGDTPADLRAALLERTTRAEWGHVPRIHPLAHVRQNVRSLILKPARELRAAVRSRRPRYPWVGRPVMTTETGAAPMAGAVSEATAAERRWTSADLDVFPEDGKHYEIIDGDLYVSRQPDFQHQLTSGELLVALRAWSRQTGAGTAVIEPGLIFADDEDVVPDVVWISRERLPHVLGEDGKLHAAPELVVEVFSPGPKNERRDREVKLTLYSRQGVREYWIADWQGRQVLVHRRERGALRLIATLHDDDTLESPLLPGFTCRVGDLFPSTS